MSRRVGRRVEMDKGRDIESALHSLEKMGIFEDCPEAYEGNSFLLCKLFLLIASRLCNKRSNVANKWTETDKEN